MDSNTKKLTLWFPLSLVLYEIPLYLSNNLFLSAFPSLKQSFHTSNSTVELSITYWFLGASTLQLILGPLSDHYGHKKVLLSGGILFLFATSMCATTTSMTWFLVGRFLQGCVISTILVTGYAMIHELLDTQQAIKINSWMGSITVMVPAGAPLLGGFLLNYGIHWRGLFAALIGLASLSLIMLYIFMPQDKKKPESLKIKGIIKDYHLVCTNSNFWVYTLSFCGLLASLAAWNTFSPFYLMDYLQFSLLGFGYIQMLIYGGFILGLNINSKLSLSIEQTIKRGLAFSVIFLGFSFISFLYIPKNIVLILIFLTLFTFSAGVIFYLLSRKAMETTKAPMGTKMAVFSTAMNLFSFLGSFEARFLHFQ
ncbi:MFS transporter [Rickettsiella endosymbiont of Dermanyssus gallinae]|uniref:MFS transporter n=1 Tax=Rickettsiella endosymbiont of Dermanyssus gallinae TaxID=2856608 RepID=UPI001C52AEF7|nr:MFS transporter [Rickettsiella endosymbiont of Dermanyssus gallinae]